LGTGHWVLDAGNLKLETGNLKFETGCWMVDGWMVETGNWALATGCASLVEDPSPGLGLLLLNF